MQQGETHAGDVGEVHYVAIATAAVNEVSGRSVKYRQLCPSVLVEKDILIKLATRSWSSWKMSHACAHGSYLTLIVFAGVFTLVDFYLHFDGLQPAFEEAQQQAAAAGGHYASEAQATPRVDVGDPPLRRQAFKEQRSWSQCLRICSCWRLCSR